MAKTVVPERCVVERVKVLLLQSPPATWCTLLVCNTGTLLSTGNRRFCCQTATKHALNEKRDKTDFLSRSGLKPRTQRATVITSLGPPTKTERERKALKVKVGDDYMKVSHLRIKLDATGRIRAQLGLLSSGSSRSEQGSVHVTWVTWKQPVASLFRARVCVSVCS